MNAGTNKKKRKSFTIQEVPRPGHLYLRGCLAKDESAANVPKWPFFPILFVKLGLLFASNDRNRVSFWNVFASIPFYQTASKQTYQY